MEELAYEFTAADEDGREYQLQVYQNWISAATRADPAAVIPGMRRIVTEDGLSVNRLAKGEYQIVSTGMVLRSSKPDAP